MIRGYVPLEIMEQRETELKAAFALALWRICEQFPESERGEVFKNITKAVEEIEAGRDEIDEWKFNIDCKETNVYLVGHC